MIDDDISTLLKELRKQEDSGIFTYQNEFVKLLTLLTPLLTKNSSEKIKDEIKLFN